jgi:hypothetical protein
MMFLVLFFNCKCDTELTRVCVRGVVTPTSGRANGLNMPPPLKFMTSTTLYYNNYKKKNTCTVAAVEISDRKDLNTLYKYRNLISVNRIFIKDYKVSVSI